MSYREIWEERERESERGVKKRNKSDRVEQQHSIEKPHNKQQSGLLWKYTENNIAVACRVVNKHYAEVIDVDREEIHHMQQEPICYMSLELSISP